MKYNRIRDLREDKDLTQTVMGKAIMVGQTTYSSYERGIANIPTDVWIRLAIFHNVSIDYLVGLTDVKTPPLRKRERN
jgi:hypothetical protein